MTDAEARAILREHGHEPPVKGKLGEEWKATAADILSVITSADDPPGDLTSQNATGNEAAGDDRDPGRGEPEEEAGEPEETAGRVVEMRPRRPRRPRGSLRDRFAGSSSSSRARPRRTRRKPARPLRERVPVDKLAASVWTGAARLAAYVSVPVSRTLELEAGLAGQVVEDSIRGTFVDRFAQPLAHAQDKARGLSAIFAPPALVLAIEACQGLPEAKRQMRLAVLLPLLEQSLIIQAKVTGERASVIAERAEEDQRYREAAQAQIAMIFAPPPGAAEAAAAAASSPEDEAAADAQRMAGV